MVIALACSKDDTSTILTAYEPFGTVTQPVTDTKAFSSLTSKPVTNPEKAV